MANRSVIGRCAGIVVSVVGLALGFLGSAARAQSNLVWNGSFEAGPVGQNEFTDWDWLGGADNFSDYGVVKASGGAAVAEQGTNYAFFKGHPTDNSQDCLGTTVNVKAGALYNISYYLGTDGPSAGTGAEMWVVIGTSFGISSVDEMLTDFRPNSSSALPYQKFSTNYVGQTGSPIVLSFHGVNGTNGLAATESILLDNVSMTLLYPPLSLHAASNQLVFRWPLTNSPYRLQANASLSTTNWVTLTNVPANLGTNSQVVMPMSGSG